MGPLAVREASVSTAEQVITFTPQVPPSSWGAATIYALKVGTNSSIGWLYEVASGQPQYILIERIPSKTEAQLEAAATCGAGEVGCVQSDWYLVTLSDGTQALVGQDNFTRSLNWLRGGVEYLLMAPAAEMTVSQAEQMANQL